MLEATSAEAISFSSTRSLALWRFVPWNALNRTTDRREPALVEFPVMKATIRLITWIALLGYVSMFVSFCFLFWHVCKLSWQTEQATLPPPVSSLPVGQRGPLRNAYGVANEACLMFRKWLANVHVNEVKLCYCKFCQVVVMWPRISQPELHRCSLVKFGLAVWLVHWLCFGLAGPVALRPRSLVSDNAGSCSCHRFARLGSRSPACKAKTNGTEETWLEGMTWWRDMTRECLCFLDVFGMSCFFVNSQDHGKSCRLGFLLLMAHWQSQHMTNYMMTFAWV